MQDPYQLLMFSLRLLHIYYRIRAGSMQDPFHSLAFSCRLHIVTTGSMRDPCRIHIILFDFLKTSVCLPLDMYGIHAGSIEFVRVTNLTSHITTYLTNLTSHITTYRDVFRLNVLLRGVQEKLAQRRGPLFLGTGVSCFYAREFISWFGN
jgi:hypothetical protein